MDDSTKYAMVKFIKFVQDELALRDQYKVSLVYQRSPELKTYAYYDPESKYIKVYCKGRGLADVLRSVAHEMVHHLQNQRGELEQPVQDIGGKIEDDANSVAGQLVKKYGYANPDLAIFAKTL